MHAIRPIVSVLLAALTLAGCSLYRVDYRLWEKTNAPNSELERDLSACGPPSKVGEVTGSSDPRTYFKEPITPEQTQANRLFEQCMAAKGWYPLQPPL